ncbi:SDR family oxidoreductase [Rhodococcus triatomae]|uniref:Short-chain dehydrogenase n=1 Tax=Rhodococcus triatomae TaxID=300028 RepID=A0A1G8A5B8_9NOCA|nr:SDR family oxidoreductase [Rhodococcus triatomae]QNG22466.1 SDR family oxidoreductase [Rhodococcus triatomae]SDH15590.1 hypothetical protein SAMN05444695_101312 [Rhodococcus triatomae]
MRHNHVVTNTREKDHIHGAVIAVTGGARGIGRDIARQLAARGARVAIGDLDGDAATATADELSGELHGHRVDVADQASFRSFLEAVTAQWGAPDVVVANAGVMWVGPFDEEPEAAQRRQFDVNVHGVINAVKLAAPAMRARGSGHIVTVASAAAKLVPPGESTYAATKHAVLGYLTGVRAELRGSGVHISAIMPAVVDTELAAGTATGAAHMLQPADVARAVVSVIERPRFQVTVPRYIGPLVAVVGLLPQSLRDFALRRAVPNQVEAVRGDTSRRGYEQRVVDSGGHADPESRQIE